MLLIFLMNKENPLKTQGVIVVVIVWQLDLQLPMQSVPITTKVLSWNPAQARFTRYIIIIWLSFSVTCDMSVDFSSSSTNKTDRHDITEILLKVAINTTTLTSSL